MPGTVQVILANVNEKLNNQILQGSVVTYLRQGGKILSSFICSLCTNATVKELLKSVHTCKSFSWDTVNKLLRQPEMNGGKRIPPYLLCYMLTM